MSITQIQIILVGGCGLLIGLHANRRFNTPLGNRSTTRRHLYQRARLAYICVTVFVLSVLAWILDFWGILAKDSKEHAALATLAAFVLLTDGIPHIPFLSEIDRTLLEFFKRVANIPKEVQRFAEQLKPELLRVERDDLPKLRALIEDEDTLPNELGCHLSDRGNEISQYRFTRVLKLYKGLMDLELSSKYGRFFADSAEEWERAQQKFQNFCLRSVPSLELEVKYRAENAVAIHKELLEELQENLRLRCRERFSDLAVLLAGALVSSLADTEQIDAALRQVGFKVDYEKTIEFPVNELTGLALALIMYVALAYTFIQPLLAHFEPEAGPKLLPSATWPLLTILSYTAAVVTTIESLMAHPRVLTRPGRPWLKYIVCAAAAAVPVALLCSLVVGMLWLQADGLHWQLLLRMPLTVGAMCFLVAFFCESDVGHGRATIFRQLGEALAVAFTTALAGVVLVIDLGSLSHKNGSWIDLRTFLFTIFNPASLGAIVGFYVPHMYRMSRYIEPSRQTTEEKGVESHRLKIVKAGRVSEAELVHSG
jgi:hypothetical protein